jgi:hypothetical protein
MSILHSYRWRRRLIAASVTIGVLGPLIFLGVHYSSPGNPSNANGPEVPDYAQPKEAPFTPAKQRAVRRVLKEFISSAVVRNDVSRSWNIAAPSMRQGVTYKQWKNGQIPVSPYPAANKGWGKWSYVEFSYRNSVGLEVFLFPRPGSGWSAMSADVGLVRARDGRWLVDYWMPKRFHGPPALAAKAKANAKKAAKQRERRQAADRRRAQPATPPNPDEPRAGGLWWMLPIGLLSLAVLIPAGFGLYTWRRNRKIRRDYLRAAR